MRVRTLTSSAACRRAAFAIAGFALLLGGCSNPTQIATSLIPIQTRLEEADRSISEAVDAFNKGSQSQGDDALRRAVQLLTLPTDDGFSDDGFIEVAKRVASKGRPQDAVRLLEPLTKDKNKSISDDPYLWGVLSTVAKQAGNAPRSAAAAAESQMLAENVLKQAGRPLPKPDDISPLEKRFIRTGGYYEEIAKDYPKALQALREARRLMPDDPDTANTLGYELADHGTTPADFAQAVQLTDLARTKYDDNPFYVDSYGWALFKRDDAKQKDLEGARRVLREAVDLAPSLPECRYHLAVVYDKLGLLTDADLEAQRAIALRPDYAEAKALHEELKARIAAAPSPTPSPSSTPAAAPTASPTPAATPSPVASPSPHAVAPPHVVT